jgi:predicted nucleic acid-binding protein
MNYIIDNCSLVNLANCGLLTICVSELAHNFYVTPLVCDKECISCKDEVVQLIDNKFLYKLDFEPNIEDFASLSQLYAIDDGECESILACQANSYALVSDDNAARRCADVVLGSENRTGSLGLIKQLVAMGIIACSQAVVAYKTMKKSGAFLPKIDPVRELC